MQTDISTVVEKLKKVREKGYQVNLTIDSTITFEHREVETYKLICSIEVVEDLEPIINYLEKLEGK